MAKITSSMFSMNWSARTRRQIWTSNYMLVHVDDEGKAQFQIVQTKTLPSKKILSTVSSCTTTRNRQHRNVYPTARRSKAGSTILFISNPLIAYIWRVELEAEATRCSTPFPMSSNPVGISANQSMHTNSEIWIILNEKRRYKHLPSSISTPIRREIS